MILHGPECYDNVYKHLFMLARQSKWQEVNILLAGRPHIAYSTDPFEGEWCGYTLIDHAVIQGNIDQVLYLHKSVRLNLRPSFTVLTHILTLTQDRWAIIEYLHDNNLININVVFEVNDEKFITLYDYLKRNGCSHAALWIAKNFGARSYSDIVKWDLLCAASQNRWDLVFSYLNKGADPKMQSNNWTLLHYACHLKNSEAMRILRDDYHLGVIDLLSTDHPNKMEYLAYYVNDIPTTEPLIFNMIEKTIPIGVQGLNPQNDPIHIPIFEREKTISPIMRPYGRKFF